MKAFNELGPSRQYIPLGMSGVLEGSIPISEIRSYCDLMQINDPDDRSDFLEMIQAIDRVYLEELSARRAANSDKTKPTGK